MGRTAGLRGAALTELTGSLIADKTKFPKPPHPPRRRCSASAQPHTLVPCQPFHANNPPDSRYTGVKMRGKRSKQYRKLMEQ